MYLFQRNLDSWICSPKGGDKHFNIVHKREHSYILIIKTAGSGF